MKKLLSVLVLSMVCLLSACSFLYTLDTNGNATITVDKSITVNVTNYSVTTLTAIATVEFTNTSKEDKDFDVSEVKCFNVDDETKSLVVIPANLSTSALTGKIGAGSTVKYTFTVTYLTADLNDYKVSFVINDTELFIALDSESSK